MVGSGTLFGSKPNPWSETRTSRASACRNRDTETFFLQSQPFPWIIAFVTASVRVMRIFPCVSGDN